MEPQPLSFTYIARTPAQSMTTPTEVNIANWDQLAGLRIQELRLTGGIDLSTASRFISFNAWLAMSKFAVTDGDKYHQEPRGSYQVTLSDESAVTITAALTCGHDFNNLALELNELLRPMHEGPQQG